MENKQPSNLKPKTSHPILVGTLFFTLFNLVLLSILSWVLLEVWFSVRLILSRDVSSGYAVQEILNNNLAVLKQSHYQYIAMPLNLFQHMESATQSFVGRYINTNSIKVFLDVTKITLTRACLFIEFIPFMLVILFVLIIDGLVLRDKRKFQGARESTFLFHRLRPLARLSFFSFFFVYMASPYNLPPILFIMPMIALSSLFTMISIKSFKKYL